MIQETQDTTPQESITESLNLIVNLRKQEREQAIKETAQEVYRYLKTFRYETITRDFLNSFFAGNIKREVKRVITNSLIKELCSNNKIQKQDTIKQGKVFFRVIPLYTCDYESYAVLMAKNGYRTYCYDYEYNKEKHIPIKKLKGICRVNARNEIKESCDAVETKSFKPIDKQGVFSNASISVKKVRQHFKISTYRVL